MRHFPAASLIEVVVWWTSVSDAPDDFVALRELKDKPDYRAKFNLTDEMVSQRRSMWEVVCCWPHWTCVFRSCPTRLFPSSTSQDTATKLR
jgi:hypothetical protein